MKTILLFISLLFVFKTCSAQEGINVDCDSVKYVYGFFKGDTINVQCDTVYMMTKPTYKIFKQYMQLVKMHKIDSLGLQIMNLSALYDSRLREKSSEYENLRSEFDSLMKSSGEMVRRTQQNVTDIDASLQSMKSNVVGAQADIDLAKKDIHRSITNLWKNKILFGTGGFVVGILSATILYAVYK